MIRDQRDWFLPRSSETGVSVVSGKLYSPACCRNHRSVARQYVHLCKSV